MSPGFKTNQLLAEMVCPGVRERMALKWKSMGNEMGRRTLGSIVSLALVLGMTACTSDYTVGYLYVTSPKVNPGLINGYKVDYQTGTLVTLEDSPIPSGGKNPVGLVADPKNHKFVYVIHSDDSNVVLFAIGTDGKLYPQATYDVTGSFPTAVAVDPTDSFLYVTFTYQKGFTPALPGPGGISIYPITTTGSGDVLTQTLGTPTTVNLDSLPVGIVLSSQNHFAYVIQQNTATTNLLRFAVDPTTGLLTTPLMPTASTTMLATPGSIIEDSTSSHIYVTDQTANQLFSYTIGANGVPSVPTTVPTGSMPMGLTIDVTGKFLYVANYNDSSLSGYTFDSNGQAVISTVAKSVSTGNGSNCVTTIGSPTNANPAHGIYLYATNALSNTVTGMQMSPQTGQLAAVVNSPFGASGLPSCIVSVPEVPRSN
jgi:6-phosphogluconolactonase